MNKLKAIFLSAFIALSISVMAGAALTLSIGGDLAIWTGTFAASAQVVAYFAWLYIAKVPRTSPGLMGFTVGIFVATMYSVFKSYDQQVASIAPMLAFLVMLGWMAYVTWYSELGDRSSDRIKVGKKLPTIRLTALDGKAVNSDDWAGQKRLVIFYRGNWCPICTAQIGELRKFKTQFDELGVRITLISPQPEYKSAALAAREGMDYDFLTDTGNMAAQTLGILHEGGLPMGLQAFGYDTDMPKPTTFALDEKGKVVYADLPTNYRLRPLPKDIIRSLS
jgi:peroxiredoxin